MNILAWLIAHRIAGRMIIMSDNVIYFNILFFTSMNICNCQATPICVKQIFISGSVTSTSLTTFTSSSYSI